MADGWVSTRYSTLLVPTLLHHPGYTSSPLLARPGWLHAHSGTAAGVNMVVGLYSVGQLTWEAH